MASPASAPSIESLASQDQIAVLVARIEKLEAIKEGFHYELRQQFKSLRTRLPTLWTRSYYVESCGHISEDTVKKYIEEQKKK